MDSTYYKDMTEEEIAETLEQARKYRIIDAHTHIYPEKIAEKATTNVGKFYDTPMANDAGTSEALISRGSQVGVEKYLVCSVATKVEQVESITRFIGRECAAHPEFIGLGGYHQDVEDPAQVLDLVEELGLKGVKLHPDFQLFNIDDPKMMPLYEEAARRGMMILFHIGDFRYDYSSLKRLMRIIEQVPDLYCQAAHYGGWGSWDDVRPTDNDHVFYDISSGFTWITDEEALRLIDLLGTDRLFWGTDFPMGSHVWELKRFFGLGLSEEDNEKIHSGNFLRFMDMLGRKN